MGTPPARTSVRPACYSPTRTPPQAPAASAAGQDAVAADPASPALRRRSLSVRRDTRGAAMPRPDAAPAPPRMAAFHPLPQSVRRRPRPTAHRSPDHADVPSPQCPSTTSWSGSPPCLQSSSGRRGRRPPPPSCTSASSSRRSSPRPAAAHSRPRSPSPAVDAAARAVAGYLEDLPDLPFVGEPFGGEEGTD